MATVNKNAKNNAPKRSNAPLFRTTNYILMAAGFILLIIGFLCLRGGAVQDSNTFDGEIFNNTRIVVSPILMFLGLALEVVAIMWHPRAKKEVENNTNE